MPYDFGMTVQERLHGFFGDAPILLFSEFARSHPPSDTFTAHVKFLSQFSQTTSLLESRFNSAFANHFPNRFLRSSDFLGNLFYAHMACGFDREAEFHHAPAPADADCVTTQSELSSPPENRSARPAREGLDFRNCRRQSRFFVA